MRRRLDASVCSSGRRRNWSKRTPMRTATLRLAQERRPPTRPHVLPAAKSMPRVIRKIAPVSALVWPSQRSKEPVGVLRDIESTMPCPKPWQLARAFSILFLDLGFGIFERVFFKLGT